MTVSARMALSRDLLVFQVAVLGHLVEVEIQAPAGHIGYGYVRGSDRRIHRILHPISKEVPQAGAHTTDGPEVTHGFTSIPLPTPVAADHGVVLEAGGHRERLRSRGRCSRRCGRPHFYG